MAAISACIENMKKIKEVYLCFSIIIKHIEWEENKWPNYLYVHSLISVGIIDCTDLTNIQLTKFFIVLKTAS